MSTPEQRVIVPTKTNKVVISSLKSVCDIPKSRTGLYKFVTKDKVEQGSLVRFNSNVGKNRSEIEPLGNAEKSICFDRTSVDVNAQLCCMCTWAKCIMCVFRVETDRVEIVVLGQKRTFMYPSSSNGWLLILTVSDQIIESVNVISDSDGYLPTNIATDSSSVIITGTSVLTSCNFVLRSTDMNWDSCWKLVSYDKMSIATIHGKLYVCATDYFSECDRPVFVLGSNPVSRYRERCLSGLGVDETDFTSVSFDSYHDKILFVGTGNEAIKVLVHDTVSGYNVNAVGSIECVRGFINPYGGISLVCNLIGSVDVGDMHIEGGAADILVISFVTPLSGSTLKYCRHALIPDCRACYACKTDCCITIGAETSSGYMLLRYTNSCIANSPILIASSVQPNYVLVELPRGVIHTEVIPGHTFYIDEDIGTLTDKVFLEGNKRKPFGFAVGIDMLMVR